VGQRQSDRAGIFVQGFNQGDDLILSATAAGEPRVLQLNGLIARKQRSISSRARSSERLVEARA
jgi:hypothetical protein